MDEVKLISNNSIETQNHSHKKSLQFTPKKSIELKKFVTPPTFDRTINLQMYHFLPEQQGVIEDNNNDNNNIDIQSINISTLTKFKLEVIMDFLKTKRNQIQVLSEINIDQDKFNSFKNIINSNTYFQIETKRFNHINGGILVLWSNTLKIKPSLIMRNYNDFRTVFLEFNPNLDLKILIVACYLPTVDLLEWQNIENLHPNITERDIRLHSADKEYNWYYNNLKTFLDPEITNQDKVILIGDLNLHQISVSNNEQHKYIIQKQLFDEFISRCRLNLNTFDESNEIDQTYFKGEKFSIVDQCFASNQLCNMLSKTKIFNDPLIQSDHNVIYVKLTVPTNEKINKPNIIRKKYVNSSQLATDEGLQSYVSALANVDITNVNLKEFIKIIKEPLMCNSKNNTIFYIDDKTTKLLKKIKKQFMKNKRFRLASLTTKRLRSQVYNERKKKTEKRVKDIASNRNKNLRSWWKLITRFVKPRKNGVNLQLSEEGQADVNATLDEFKKFFKELQYRKVYTAELESLEDWIALFFVKQQPSGVFEIQSRFIEQHIQRGTIINRALLEIFIGIQNEYYNLDWSFSDIVNSKYDSITRIEGDYQKPFQGRKVQSEELYSYLKNMKNYKAPGFDNVDACILKNLPENYMEKLADLQNQLLNHNQLDEELKQVIISLISKNDNPNPTPDDFRPISLLSVPCFKLIEKVIIERLLLNTNIFQFGFKKQNSTADMLQVLNEILENCKTKQENGIGTFVLGMYDFKKAFNSVFFLKLIAKLDARGIDKNILALLINLQMPQKVQFKIGENLSKEPISLNVQCGHQGSIFMPMGFVEQISDFIDEVERRESNLIEIVKGDQQYYSNEVMFADDYNEANQFQKQSRSLDINDKLHSNLEWFKTNAAKLHLIVADPKCKHLTNDVNKVRSAILGWNQQEVTDSAKLVGIRFKIKKNLEICQKQQQTQIQDKFEQTFCKLKVAYGINKFVSVKQGVNLVKAFCIPIVDYCNVITKFNDFQTKKLDSLLFKNVKNLLGFRQTTLSLNFQICFNLFNYKNRRRVGLLSFLLKHLENSTPDHNACSKLLQERYSEVEQNQMLWDCIEDLDISGFKEQLSEKRIFRTNNNFDISNLSLLQFFQSLQDHSKPGIHKTYIHSEFKFWIKRLIKLRLAVDQIDFEGPYRGDEMELCIGQWRVNTQHVSYQDGRNLLKNHTAWFVLRQWDFDSSKNCIELENSDRSQDKRFVKLFFCGYRLNQRIRIFTQDNVNNTHLTFGTCLSCNSGDQEDEEHFIRECSAYDDLREVAQNIALPQTNFRMSLDGFRRMTELQVFGSQSMMRRLFADEGQVEVEGFVEYNLKAHYKFNYEMKSMIKNMLDRRKELMINIPLENRQDIPAENVQRYRQFMELQKWKQ